MGLICLGIASTEVFSGLKFCRVNQEKEHYYPFLSEKVKKKKKVAFKVTMRQKPEREDNYFTCSERYWEIRTRVSIRRQERLSSHLSMEIVVRMESRQ